MERLIHEGIWEKPTIDDARDGNRSWHETKGGDGVLGSYLHRTALHCIAFALALRGRFERFGGWLLFVDDGGGGMICDGWIWMASLTMYLSCLPTGMYWIALSVMGCPVSPITSVTATATVWNHRSTRNSKRSRPEFGCTHGACIKNGPRCWMTADIQLSRETRNPPSFDTKTLGATSNDDDYCTKRNKVA
jgi:hypothetical protein